MNVVSLHFKVSIEQTICVVFQLRLKLISHMVAFCNNSVEHLRDLALCARPVGGKPHIKVALFEFQQCLQELLFH